ncbi:hypothetical protein GXW82_43210 [Streptacidiphilus sp. 4-A2]|nr:hypothetical protein [Streptacidiphilus sp. 4-A2]
MDLLAAFGVPRDRATELAGDAFGERMWKEPRVVREASVLLSRLAASGVSVAVVSNSDGTIEETLGSLGLCQVGPGRGVPVAGIIDSHVLGVEKPDPEIYRTALDVCG